jgi:Integrase core domain
LIGICRGSAYYRPVPIHDADLALMRRIDELHLEWPFAGSRMLRDLLRKHHGIEVGRRQWRDNVLVERLWKGVKYEEVSLKTYDRVSAARAGLAAYIERFNALRPPRAHGGRTPDEAHAATLQPLREAA